MKSFKVVAEPVVKRPVVPAFYTSTWEERRRMTVPELIELMGPLHVNHPDYKQKSSHSLLPMPNIAGKQPVFEEDDATFWSLCKAFVRWIAR